MRNSTIKSTSLLKSEKLPFRTKLVYGLADWSNASTSTIFGFFFAFFMTDVAKLPPLYAAPVLLIGGFWDAINDPLFGVLADRVRTRWGRRRPFFLFVSIPFAIAFIMLWWIPPISGDFGLAAYYAVTYLLFDTGFTLLAVPYSALTPELTEDYDERTRLNGYRMTFSMLGGLIGALSIPLVTGLFTEVKTGYMVVAIAFGIAAVFPYLLLFFKIRERYADTPIAGQNLLKGFLSTFRNRAFRFAAGIYMTAWVTISLASALFQYYVTYVVLMPDQLDIILGLLQLGALVCIPVMVWMANRLGKQKAYIIGLSWWTVVMLILAVIQPGHQALVFVLAISVGLGVAAAHVVPWSMVPDVIEVDELETGKRREGTYYGFLVFIQKTGVAFTLALMQWILHITHYVPGVAQSKETLTAMRLLMGPFPAVLLILSMILAWKYPLTKKRHLEVREELAKKRAIRDTG
jgi:GPH family glycoside/pentoside/hexuronide:cation symporter